MNVLIGCEESGIVRDAFLKIDGVNAWSCDLKPRDHSHHLQTDVEFAIKHYQWDLIICHPPCTALTIAGNGTYGKGKPKYNERLQAIEWTLNLWCLAVSVCPRVCFENPKSVLSTSPMG